MDLGMSAAGICGDAIERLLFQLKLCGGASYRDCTGNVDVRRVVSYEWCYGLRAQRFETLR